MIETPRQFFRIVKQKYINNLNGRGGAFDRGGRWNKPDYPIIYFGISASIAMLEMGNYAPSPRSGPKSAKVGVYEFTKEVAIERLEREDLPDDWMEFDYPTSTQEIGTDWLTEQSSVGLMVPSAAVPSGGDLDYCVLINPNHSDIQYLSLIDVRLPIYNDRLFTDT